MITCVRGGWRYNLQAQGDFSGTAINAYAEARDRTAWLICYLIASDKMTDEQIQRVHRLYNEAWGYDFQRPTDEMILRDLPKAVAPAA